MADKLIETDVEKAAVPGRSAARSRRLGGQKKLILNRLDSGMQRLGDGHRYRKLSGMQARLGRVKKSVDPVETLYAEIEKARGLLPKGGSSKAWNRAWDKTQKLKRGKSADDRRALKRVMGARLYLAGRRTGSQAGPGGKPRSGSYK